MTGPPEFDDDRELPSDRRPLVGPDCTVPRCNGITRRRRYWRCWDTTSCRKCGATYECVETDGNGKPITFIRRGGLAK